MLETLALKLIVTLMATPGKQKVSLCCATFMRLAIRLALQIIQEKLARWTHEIAFVLGNNNNYFHIISSACHGITACSIIISSYNYMELFFSVESLFPFPHKISIRKAARHLSII